MAKRLSEEVKKQIIDGFTSGKTLDELSSKFNFTKLTISRNLKKNLGEKKYKELISFSNYSKKIITKKEENYPLEMKINSLNKPENGKITPHKTIKSHLNEEFFTDETFIELTPLNFDVDSNSQKDLSSIPITEINLPNVVYMIVDKKIELEIKYLKDYPSWSFLSEDELKRKTIQIYNDLKIAKRFCNKEQKVIKVPNTEVFKMVAPILVSRGITRIVNDDCLISL